MRNSGKYLKEKKGHGGKDSGARSEAVAIIPAHIKEERFERKPAVLSRFALSDSSLYQKISEGKFPAPVHPYGPRVSVWLKSDLDRHMAEQLAAIGKEVAA